MAEAARLIHTGNVVIDLMLRVPGLPARGGDVLAGQAEAEVGGGFNVMAAAARQGMPVVYAGELGTGPWGERARAALVAEGIGWVGSALDGVDTGYVMVLVEPDGERTFVTVPGAEAQLRSQSLVAAAPRPGDWVYVSGYSLTHAPNRAALLEWLPGLDPAVTVVFDPGPLVGELDSEALAAVLSATDWLTVNQAEAMALVGAKAIEVPDSYDPAWVVPGGGAGRGRQAGLVIRRGAAGCVVKGAGRGGLIPGYPATVVDTTGAGDAHTGVFVAGLASGLAPLAAGDRANRAAAIAIGRFGPATAPTAAEL
ncbi:MAG: PfkB family carbohydrate kinase [Bifidobacteriaceae bacterium]|jgi:sugar/nucleoside kinase (ribokinase family)|nr:PfkB family carbohydrate kinase [Bifidobacteriaceae bacterium]